MDISKLAEDRQRIIDSIDNQILEAQTRKTVQEGIRDKLQELMAQSTYSIEDINFLIQNSY
jgi:hypothetical protein